MSTDEARMVDKITQVLEMENLTSRWLKGYWATAIEMTNRHSQHLFYTLFYISNFLKSSNSTGMCTMKKKVHKAFIFNLKTDLSEYFRSIWLKLLNCCPKVYRFFWLFLRILQFSYVCYNYHPTQGFVFILCHLPRSL